jgi:hypothetical protein
MSITNAVEFLLAHKKSRQEHLSIRDADTDEPLVDLSFVSGPWQPLVAPDMNPGEAPTHVSRRWFELCAITQVMQELKSGDLCIPRSDRYSDFREQFSTSSSILKIGCTGQGISGQSQDTIVSSPTRPNAIL